MKFNANKTEYRFSDGKLEFRPEQTFWVTTDFKLKWSMKQAWGPADKAHAIRDLCADFNRFPHADNPKQMIARIRGIPAATEK